MKFSMEKNKNAGHRVTIHIPNKTVNNAIFTEFINIRKKTNINGFRKGKVPIHVIKEKYGNTVYYDVFKDLMQKFFYEFIHKEKINIIGIPKYYMNQNIDKKKEYFEYFVIYETYPKFEIKDIASIKVKKIIVNITDEDIKKSIEKNKPTKINWNKVDKPIKIYDRVTINYSVYNEKNQKIEKFSRENIIFIVFKNKLVTQLENKIINHFVNDILFFKINFHEFHPEKELQNKDITFKIQIKKIEKLQEIEEKNTKKDNEKINKLEYQTLKNNLNNEIHKITEKYLENQIIENIIKKKLIVIPPILLQEEIKNLYQQYKKDYKNNNHSILEQRYHFNIHLKAKKRLYLRIIIEKIIFENQLVPNEKNIELLIKNISSNYKKSLELIDLYNQNNDFKNTIRYIDLKNQAISLLKKEIEIVKTKWNFDQFINYNWKIHKELFN
ncbi:MAG: trigger factor [Buchnera aphidicola (Brevicoryne brassicae)]|uniref:Trigger factor n=1 Tax=Buchnera aphidicola (Brevicoryne brassicae) TaxID=911343 RepID=A0AAJ5TXI1_9GAMM|nr:trigger factor [Buchnera aphidicola]QCI20021.1 trigger factor [Buchnera aphidicola (Brevicoryne brassicae)]WAI18845.1 MAG: trigger factor [Buchnera aphidicola (Brevicoryne brassicae)]